MSQEPREQNLQKLINTAKSLGADDACLLPSTKLVVNDQLAQKCFEPGCPNYGLSYSCPPYVEGPEFFRQLRGDLPKALVTRLVVPASSLLSWERVEVGRILHELVAQLEKEARELGFAQALAFAGDSCKVLFCRDHLSCRRIDENGLCRHPDLARPSMSGYGIDVFQMIQSCGWETNLNQDPDPSTELSWVAGLVLLG